MRVGVPCSRIEFWSVVRVCHQSERRSFHHYCYDRESSDVVVDIFPEDIDLLGHKFDDLPSWLFLSICFWGVVSSGCFERPGKSLSYAVAGIVSRLFVRSQGVS